MSAECQDTQIDDNIELIFILYIREKEDYGLSQAKTKTGPGHIERSTFRNDYEWNGSDTQYVLSLGKRWRAKYDVCIKKTINEHVHSVIIKIKNNAARMTNDALQTRDGGEKETAQIQRHFFVLIWNNKPFRIQWFLKNINFVCHFECFNFMSRSNGCLDKQRQKNSLFSQI